MKKTGTLSITLLALGLAVAGCGSSSTATTSSGASGASGVQGAALSDSAFAAQGNKICTAGNKTLAQAAKLLGSSNPSSADLQRYADVAVPSIQGQIDAVKALPAPSDEADQVSKFLSDAQAALDKVKADPSLFLKNVFSPINDEAKAIGLDTCAG